MELLASYLELQHIDTRMKHASPRLLVLVWYFNFRHFEDSANLFSRLRKRSLGTREQSAVYIVQRAWGRKPFGTAPGWIVSFLNNPGCNVGGGRAYTVTFAWLRPALLCVNITSPAVLVTFMRQQAFGLYPWKKKKKVPLLYCNLLMWTTRVTFQCVCKTKRDETSDYTLACLSTSMEHIPPYEAESRSAGQQHLQNASSPCS
jgi:hypothetical protein